MSVDPSGPPVDPYKPPQPEPALTPKPEPGAPSEEDEETE